jgi:WASH complex subunit strumpellin
MASIPFLAENNVCGQNLLRLVSRGSAIIAELLRLSDHIPAVLCWDLPGFGASLDSIDDGRVSDNTAKYAPVLFDFRYLKTPEMFDKNINTNLDLQELDETFLETHSEVLARFYRLFESIFMYVTDFNRFLSELDEGFFIQMTLESVLLDTDGKQLLCEALHLWGVMLLLMDMRIPGPARERLVVAQMRHKGEGSVPIVELAKLTRDTGYRAEKRSLGSFSSGEAIKDTKDSKNAPIPIRRPANYPEDFFARFPVPKREVEMILGRLRSDDVYNSARVFPAPEQRSVALAQQASMIYVILYFSPKTLIEGKSLMREIVDKHFSDNWVVPVYMGVTADLSVEWDRYKAAKDALALDTLQVNHVKEILRQHTLAMASAHKSLDQYLLEGVLTETFVVDQLANLTEVVRQSNIALRWVLLHRRSETKKWKDLVYSKESGFPDRKLVLDLLLRVSIFEFKLKLHVKHLLAVKDTKWTEKRQQTMEIMIELGDYFSGQRALTRVERDEGLMQWFQNLGKEVAALDVNDALLSGRKMRQLIKALDDVTSFDVIDASPNIKEFLNLAKTNITEMVRTCNITEQTLSDLNILSDFSYAWEIMHEFVPDMQDKVRADPTAVQGLRAAFLKLTSMLEVPLVRVSEAKSPDTLSVAEYYSGELVDFLRNVMEVIPIIIFAILKDAIVLQSRGMQAMPVRVEQLLLKDLAQLEQRAVLARRTHEIGIFADGILAMEKTLLGVIRVDPRQILKDGISKHLVSQISRSFHLCLSFDLNPQRGKDPKAAVEGALQLLRDQLFGVRNSFEYVQDYLALYGLRMWQEQFSRIVAFNTEQESNKFSRRRILPEASEYQSRAIPLPLFLRPPPGDVPMPGSSGLSSNTDKSAANAGALSSIGGSQYLPATTFMGRLANALLELTRCTRTVYGPGPTGGAWLDPTGREVAGVGLFVLLNSAVGVPGLSGLDKLYGLNVERELTRLLRLLAGELKAGATVLLTQVTDELQPTSAVSSNVVRVFQALGKRLAKPLESMTDSLVAIGHHQLLRKAIAHELRFSARLESNLLAGAVESLNTSLIVDLRKHYSNPQSHPLPDEDNLLLAQTSRYCESTGINDPLTNIYLSAEPALQPTIGLWLAVLVATMAPRLAFDKEFGVLTSRKLSDGIDGGPLISGIVTLLKQMHPNVTDDFFAHTGQYIRSTVHATTGASVLSVSAGNKKTEAELSKSPPVLPVEVFICLLVVQQVARVAHVPERVLHSHLPAYILNATYA